MTDDNNQRISCEYCTSLMRYWKKRNLKEDSNFEISLETRSMLKLNTL